MSRDYYRRNPKLKREGVQIEFTQDQIQELIKCKNDPGYFIKTYMKVVHVDKGVIPFIPRKYQWEMIHAFNTKRWVIEKCARQSGKSIACIAYILWYILFNEHKKVAILANKAATSREMLGRLQLAYENLPLWLQSGIVEWNKGTIQLENGSAVIATSTSADAIRGFAQNIILLDEFAFVDNNMADKFFASVYPVISSGDTTQLFMISTPNGMNHFYKFWTEAEQGLNDYYPIAVSWRDVPGRDEAWAEMTKRNMGEERFAQEMECEFLGSQNTLIPPRDIKAMAVKKPIFRDPDQQGFDVFEFPQDGHLYCIVADVGHGKGLDYSAAQVIDITNYPFKQVARYRNNEVTSLVYPMILYKIGKMYNMADILVENLDQGSAVCNILQYDLEYDNVIAFGDELGVRTNKAIKHIGCDNLKQIIRDKKLEICDVDTISEISTFIIRNGKYQADVGAHDDLVMSLVLFAWLVTQERFATISDHDLRRQMQVEKEKALEESLLPMGFINDGLDFELPDGWENIELDID